VEIVEIAPTNESKITNTEIETFDGRRLTTTLTGRHELPDGDAWIADILCRLLAVQESHGNEVVKARKSE